MIKNNLFTKNNIQNQYLNKKIIKKLSKNFFKILGEVTEEINQDRTTLGVLNNKFKFNFNIKDLNKFKKYKSIAVVGMGGSILGTEAI